MWKLKGVRVLWLCGVLLGRDRSRAWALDRVLSSFLHSSLFGYFSSLSYYL